MPPSTPSRASSLPRLSLSVDEGPAEVPSHVHASSLGVAGSLSPCCLFAYELVATTLQKCYYYMHCYQSFESVILLRTLCEECVIGLL